MIDSESIADAGDAISDLVISLSEPHGTAVSVAMAILAATIAKCAVPEYRDWIIAICAKNLSEHVAAFVEDFAEKPGDGCSDQR